MNFPTHPIWKWIKKWLVDFPIVSMISTEKCNLIDFDP